MRTNTFRRVITPLTAAAAMTAGVVVFATPAAAASLSGRLQLKGPGSLYITGEDHGVTQAVARGSAATFSLKVVNTGSSVAQYNLKLQVDSGATISLATGSLITTPLASGPDGYYTTPIKPGAAEVMTLKLTPSTAPSQKVTFYGLAYLYATDGTFLQRMHAAAEIKAPAAGTTGYDLFVHNGAQAAVGGSQSYQTATAPAVKLNGVASYVVRLKNDSAVSTLIGLQLFDFDVNGCTDYWTTTVKAGSIDVTAAVIGGYYVTPIITKGGFKDLTLTMKYVALAPSDECTQTTHELWTRAGQSGPYQIAVAVLGHAAA